MSYDIYLMEPDGAQIIVFDNPPNMDGGVVELDVSGGPHRGHQRAWLNVTYNYARHYVRTMGPQGIRTIYGMTGADSIPLLDAAIAQLGNDFDTDYYRATEGNAKRALMQLKDMARLRRDGVWRGD